MKSAKRKENNMSKKPEVNVICSNGTCGAEAAAYRRDDNIIRPLCLGCIRPVPVASLRGLERLLEDVRKES